jgi:hypothetical protein
VISLNKHQARTAVLKILIEIIGWAAAAMMLSAYLMLTSGRLSSISGVYQWLDVALRRRLHHQQRLEWRLTLSLLNVVWMTIGLYGALRGTRLLPGPAA